MDLINNNINRDVQRNVQTARRMCKHGCTGYVHITLSPVNVGLMLSCKKDADFIFKQYLAPAHTAKSAKSCLNDHVLCA